MDPFGFQSSPLTNVEHFISANSLVERASIKFSNAGLLLDYHYQHRPIYATFKLLAQFSFASAIENGIIITQRQ